MNKFAVFFKKYTDVFKAIVVLTVICLVVSAALAATNEVTKAKIAEIDAATATQAMEALIPESTYEKVEGENDFYIAKSGDKINGYIITDSAKGYGGDVKVMTAFDETGAVIGVNILSVADETPGLGQNVTKENFYNQYKGKNEKLTVVKNGAKDGEINAVTGATITSRAVTSAVNDSMDILNEYLEAKNTLEEVQ